MKKLKLALGVSLMVTSLSTTALVYSNSGKIITAEIKADYVTNVDGIKQTFLDANGNEVFPILYDGSTYIPLRAVGNLMNKDVKWDQNNKIIDLDSKAYSQSTGTTTSSTTTSTTTANTGYIGEEKAKEIALSDAGITNSADVDFLTVKFEIDDSIPEYSVEFYDGNKEYDYEIHALTGVIIGKDMDIEWYVPTENSSNSQRITADEAKQIAATHSGQTIANMEYVKVEYDIDDGIAVYEVEWKKDRIEYDYTIDAATGQIIKYDVDRD